MAGDDGIAAGGGVSEIYREAWISKDGVYRYSLSREWGTGGGFVNFVMLNPSTADANVDDPTIRRCISFAQGWGFGGLIVTNLFAFRATDPKDMRKAADPVGPYWADAVYKAVLDSREVVLAWGGHGKQADLNRLKETISAICGKVSHLGLVKNGNPKHPLYLGKETKRQPWGAFDWVLP